MSIKSMITLYAMGIATMIPSKDDWQVKIDAVADEYWNKTIHLPRKQKKRRRKELNKTYSFYKSMQKWKPFEY